MGATSVTGVSGVGSAERKGNKGSERMTLGVDRLVGPRVVMAGVATVGQGGTVDVELPNLVGTVSQYSIQLTPNTGAATFSNFALTGTTNEDLTSSAGFTITGTAGAVVYWSVLKNGIWGAGQMSDLANT